MPINIGVYIFESGKIRMFAEEPGSTGLAALPHRNIHCVSDCFAFSLNILVARNHESGNLEIGVPLLGNRLFCA